MVSNDIRFVVVFVLLLAFCGFTVKASLCSSGNVGDDEPCFTVDSNYDHSKKIQQGQSVTFECTIKNKGSYSIVWLHDGQLLSLDGKILKPDTNIQLDTDLSTRFNLKINNIDAVHRGLYKCQITTFIARNLEYELEVLVPPTITRSPSQTDIIVREGESLTVQCLTQGNPKPKITWTKKGKLPSHFKIDDQKSTLFLKDMDASYADTYTCMAMNGVGTPVTSEFQVYVKYKPRIIFNESENIMDNTLYSTIGKNEKILCTVDSYPKPKITILYNNTPISSSNLVVEEATDSTKQTVTYNFQTSPDTIGKYECIADNEIGVMSESLLVTASISNITISNDVYQIYSDGYVFEWSALSGSPLSEIQIELYTNDTLELNQTSRINIETAYAGGVQYKDYYELSKLNSNTSYEFRVRVKNENSEGIMSEWSDWSREITFKTLIDDNNNNRLSKHKSLAHQHRHHNDRKYKLYDLHGNFNAKQNTYDYNTAPASPSTVPTMCLLNLFFVFLFY